jgi:uncharacterized Zn finger protein
MEKALACKCCGSEDTLQFKHIGTYGHWWVHCDTCGAIGPEKPTMTQAGRAWNEEQKKK